MPHTDPLLEASQFCTQQAKSKVYEILGGNINYSLLCIFHSGNLRLVHDNVQEVRSRKIPFVDCGDSYASLHRPFTLYLFWSEL